MLPREVNGTVWLSTLEIAIHLPSLRRRLQITTMDNGNLRTIWSEQKDGERSQLHRCGRNCVASYAQGITGFWTEQFAMSKVAELVDAGFIVLRKRPLLFLHWYHHITVLMYTWHAYKDHTASGRWFIWMNYGVHALMYSYYALSAIKIRPSKQIAMLVTILQISQMVMGVSIGFNVLRIKNSDEYCQQTYEKLGLCFTIYFLLFCNFFYHAYLKKNNRYQSAKPLKTEKVESVEELSGEDVNANKIVAHGITTRSAAKRRVQKAD